MTNYNLTSFPLYLHHIASWIGLLVVGLHLGLHAPQYSRLRGEGWLAVSHNMAVARDPVAGSYADMKRFHDRAYSLISEALNIDESGVGELHIQYASMS